MSFRAFAAVQPQAYPPLYHTRQHSGAFGTPLALWRKTFIVLHIFPRTG